MAKKEISGYVKLQIKGGQANPAPPVGPALGQRGINIMEFCQAFNEKTKNFMGKPVPVVITIYKDKKFDFIIKSPPASHFIKEAVKLKSGSQEPGRNIVASITKKQLEEIAKQKMADLNAHDIDEASKIIAPQRIKNYLFFEKKNAPRFIIIDSIIISIDSKNNICIFKNELTNNIANSCPNIAIHLILIKFVSKIVFTYNLLNIQVGNF